ncbi:unnamed protein product [Notodromas monacha]|uniref:B30.2/SPRY domain-containing protein n=1 Tax=Notodromas monacha TaxID=399045 RepID=A0A7R9GDN6_9CRUS|nr:unnamed protein product [Notodromas monacha]CAG0917146.1 unnamed protein product [Notodromas monacha]
MLNNPTDRPTDRGSSCSVVVVLIVVGVVVVVVVVRWWSSSLSYVIEPPSGDASDAEGGGGGGGGTSTTAANMGGLPNANQHDTRTYRAEKTYAVTSGKWYYEFEVLTPGSMRVGWARVAMPPGLGLGADDNGWAYDGCNEEKLFGGAAETYGKQWAAGDVIGVLLDLVDRTISFSLNGELMMDAMGGETAFSDISVPADSPGFVPAFTFSVGQRAKVLFGQDVQALRFFSSCGLQEGYQPFCVNMKRAVTLWYNRDLPMFENVDDVAVEGAGSQQVSAQLVAAGVIGTAVEVTRMPAGSDSPPSLKISHKFFETMERATWEFLRLSLPIRCQTSFIDESDKSRRWQEIRVRQQKLNMERPRHVYSQPDASASYHQGDSGGPVVAGSRGSPVLVAINSFVRPATSNPGCSTSSRSLLEISARVRTNSLSSWFQRMVSILQQWKETSTQTPLPAPCRIDTPSVGPEISTYLDWISSSENYLRSLGQKKKEQKSVDEHDSNSATLNKPEGQKEEEEEEPGTESEPIVNNLKSKHQKQEEEEEEDPVDHLMEEEGANSDFKSKSHKNEEEVSVPEPEVEKAEELESEVDVQEEDALDIETPKGHNSHKLPGVAQARISGCSKYLEVSWGNGEVARYPWVWLRDNCQCPKCFQPSAKARLLVMKDLDVDCFPSEVKLEGSDVKVTWQDGHESLWNPDWLQQHIFDDEKTLKSRETLLRNKRIMWKEDFQPKDIPKGQFGQVLTSDEKLLEFLVNLEVHGIHLLENVPPMEGMIHKLADRVAFLRATNYG